MMMDIRPHKVNFLFLVHVRVRVHLVSFPDIQSLGTRHSCPGFPIAHAQHIHVSGSGLVLELCNDLATHEYEYRNCVCAVNICGERD